MIIVSLINIGMSSYFVTRFEHVKMARERKLQGCGGDRRGNMKTASASNLLLPMGQVNRGGWFSWEMTAK